ncbi:hypothetical protein Syun_014052 [Stephania yunnanensis]|uniref:Uncharacterized protein n=1 Tax=Stephania yunnanensis TaxID=152371 RepID=A0AAP0P8E3_9MAGN
MGAILHNQMTTLCNYEFVFENQRSLARSIHRMEHTISKTYKLREGTSDLVSSTQMRLPLSSNLDVSTLLDQEYHLYDHAVSYRSQKIDPMEDDDDATYEQQH